MLKWSLPSPPGQLSELRTEAERGPIAARRNAGDIFSLLLLLLLIMMMVVLVVVTWIQQAGAWS